MQLQDEERRRLARELHDSTGQMLAALNIALTLLKDMSSESDAKMAKIIQESGALTEELTRQIRTMSYLLHPPLLDEAGLESALRWYVEGFSQRSNIAVDIQVSENLGRLSSEVEIALFRVVQESLTNVHRHSGSRVANVHIARDSDRVALEIRDEGKTEQAGKKSFAPGVGILGMRERVRQLGGRLEIFSDEHGTLIRALVPIDKNVVAEMVSCKFSIRLNRWQRVLDYDRHVGRRWNWQWKLYGTQVITHQTIDSQTQRNSFYGHIHFKMYAHSPAKDILIIVPFEISRPIRCNSC